MSTASPVTDEQAFIEKDILGYLSLHQKKELCRFTTDRWIPYLERALTVL